MQSSRDSSSRPLLSPDNPQQERAEMIHPVNKNQINNHDQDKIDYHQQQDRDQQINPWVNYPPHSRSPSGSRSRPHPRSFNYNGNGTNSIRPLMEYNDPNDSSSDV
ncbi:unnamed protein product [Rotaria socialis]|uniref:Uncharacterized protein n=1 Tax=Rotaria socialis TaxID=392032 RepID=A0A821G3P1_9BILA|nr:unnamed protein product [Rotaria socialis]